jgi:hypothetical protein
MDAADPSLATKEEETRRLENIIYDCGKAAKLLLDGSHQHEVRCTSPPPPQFPANDNVDSRGGSLPRIV